jgi:predicted protein tyrosine phosphatase
MLRATKFLSRHEAKMANQPILFHAAIISIEIPDEEEVLILSPPFNRVLNLKFHDVDPQGCSDEWCMNYTTFGEEHAAKVFAFAEECNLNSEIDELWVHCDAGISRSAAVAKYIASVYNLYFPETYMIYNKHVFSTLCSYANQQFMKEDK